ncbi:MAG TPA: hypothetical protein VHM70_10905 [Polyangiaceae bacterium]|nr:hypothetical protein [Polyangiaceae bacterium]
MRILCRAGTVAIAISALAACGTNDSNPEPKPPFEADGSWVYLGPSDPPHILTITDATMKFTSVANDWSSDWTVQTYDSDLNHFQITFGSGTGTYLPVGDSVTGTYDLNGTVFTVQLAPGLVQYPVVQGPGTCTSPTDGTPVPLCMLYIKQN